MAKRLPVLVASVFIGALGACEGNNELPEFFFDPPPLAEIEAGIPVPDGGAPETGRPRDADAPDAAGTDPNTVISSKPAEKTKETSASIAFSSDVAGATFLCSIDGATPAPCTSPFSATVAEGAHTFSVAAVVGSAKDPTPAVCAWTVDTTPPNTTISAGPTGHVDTGDAHFSFTSTEPGSTFECAFDSAAYAPCTSPHAANGFAVGAHSFSVRAIDPSGNPDPTPATRTWTVDRTGTAGPPLTLTVAPLQSGKTTSNAQVSYASTASSITFLCRTYLQGDAAPAFATCPQAPAQSFALSGFSHDDVVVIEVEGRDAGNNPNTIKQTVTVDAKGPEITITAPAARIGGDGKLTFTATDGLASTYTCSVLDAGGTAIATGPCTAGGSNGLAFSIAASGNYTARVEGVDLIGNTTITNQAFVVDVTGPTTTIGKCTQNDPDDPIQCAVSTSADATRLQCRVVDLTAFGPCGAGTTTALIPGGAVGANLVEVRAVDDLGNVGAASKPQGVSGVRYTTGHAVLIGHDFTAIASDAAKILGNAADLSYVKRLGLRRHARVLMWCSTESCDSAEEENIRRALANVSITAADISTFYTPPADLGTLLIGRDIFLVADQNGTRNAIESIGKGWTDSMVTNFAAKGGSVIVLDGLQLDEKSPSATYGVLVGPGIFNATGVAGATGSTVTYGATDDDLQAGVTDGYTGPNSTVGFVGADLGWTRSFVIGRTQQTVLHLRFRN